MTFTPRNPLVARLFPQWPDIDSNTFILWEPCSRSHGEIVPGYARVLLDLGYRVVVLMTPARLGEGLFSRMDDPRLQLTQLSQRQIRKFMRRPEVHDAAGILVTTQGKLPHDPQGRPDWPAIFGARIPRHLHGVSHNAKTQIDAGVWDPRTITLRALDYCGATSQVVNPHVFGTVKTPPKNTDTCVFLMVGAARAKRRNQSIVHTAATRLRAAGHENFEIRLIGKPDKNNADPGLARHIVHLGRLDFSDMYAQIEASDFILTAFQPDNPDHIWYRQTGTTGSFQLCYGFHKPCIVQQAFTTGTALRADNSILYEDDDEMFDAMRTAIEMNAAQYAGLQHAMGQAATALHKAGTATMKALIDG